jgi:hypothetical protein
VNHIGVSLSAAKQLAVLGLIAFTAQFNVESAAIRSSLLFSSG